MPLIQYKPIDFSADKLTMIARANLIIANYNKQGFDLTLRQLYYVFVAQDLFPDDWKYVYIGNNKWRKDPNGTNNAPNNYNALGALLGDARLAGLMDWHAIVDRTRNVVQNQHWQKPSDILNAARQTYAIDKWADQEHYIEVWVEKDALKGVVAAACQPLDVPYFSCRGYTSLSEMWAASQRLLIQQDKGKEVHIIHLGDHDPSGINMTEDINNRLEMFTYGKLHVDRIALNMDQIEEFTPPPNPAKTTDSRFKDYQAKFGDESWELDALPPEVLVRLIHNAVHMYCDEQLWEKKVKQEERGRSTLQYICQFLPDVVQFLRKRRDEDKSPIICQTCGATQNNPKCICTDTGDAIILLGG